MTRLDEILHSLSFYFNSSSNSTNWIVFRVVFTTIGEVCNCKEIFRLISWYNFCFMMEIDSVSIVDGRQAGTKNETSEPVKQERVLAGDGKCYSSTDTVQGNKADTGEEEGNVAMDSGGGDVNMEASISADDVMRAEIMKSHKRRFADQGSAGKT
ncbi:unnamed protein product [Lactuca saligna]|uniref:Uncharacterized protein n=1 Tax=Lactuca saligna TaxID=75948 RepID=A0AA35ZYU7_LACSI|nr:unnamed protein product [Lactuca saligna]